MPMSESPVLAAPGFNFAFPVPSQRTGVRVLLDSVSPAENNSSVLDQIAHRIRESHRVAQEAGAALLHHAFEAGDALNEAQARVSTNWKGWLKEYCFLSVCTALVYQQLARHRDEIEARIEEVGQLNLRAALRFISKQDPGARKEPGEMPGSETVNPVLAVLKAATDAQVTTALALD
jgi:hypothetical protein